MRSLTNYKPLSLASLRRRPLLPLFPQEWGGEIHLSYFTPKTLRKALANAGLECSEFGVDDVHLQRSAMVSLRYHLNRLLNHFFSWHCEPAMYLVNQREFNRGYHKKFTMTTNAFRDTIRPS